MGRQLKAVLKYRGEKLRKFNIHVEDFLDIIDLRVKCFEEIDEILRKNPNAAKAFKELKRINGLYTEQFNNRWNSDLLNRFCKMHRINNILQRKIY